MDTLHPKAVRRRLLVFLYERYLLDPRDVITPDDIIEAGCVERKDLLTNAFYLNDRGLIELMLRYHPHLFDGARITADGIDLVENTFELNLRFPPQPGEAEEAVAEVPVLVECLFEEGELSALDGEGRKCLLRDIQYLRDELARPALRWRHEVIRQVLDWIGGHFDEPYASLPSLAKLETLVEQQRGSALG